MKDISVIGDDEFLYRKMPVKPGWYDPDQRDLKPVAFKPRKDDTDGISFDRAKSLIHPEFRSLEQAAVGQSPLGYYIAVFSVRTLRFNGFTIAENAIEDNPGHALIADLTISKYEESDPEGSREKMTILAHKLLERVEGPFHSESADHG